MDGYFYMPYEFMTDSDCASDFWVVQTISAAPVCAGEDAYLTQFPALSTAGTGTASAIPAPARLLIQKHPPKNRMRCRAYFHYAPIRTICTIRTVRSAARPKSHRSIAQTQLAERMGLARELGLAVVGDSKTPSTYLFTFLLLLAALSPRGN